MEIVLSIIAIVISSVSLFFNAYPVYCKYMRKKEKTIMYLEAQNNQKQPEIIKHKPLIINIF